MRMRGAIFDVDGTLLDSMFIWDTIGETYLRSIGYEPRENLNEVFKNMSLLQAARYYQTEYGVTLCIRPLAKLAQAVKVADASNQRKVKCKTVSAIAVALREDTKSFDKADNVFNKDTIF